MCVRVDLNSGHCLNEILEVNIPLHTHTVLGDSHVFT